MCFGEPIIFLFYNLGYCLYPNFDVEPSRKDYDAKYKMELPYDGVKEMILVDNVEDSDFLCQLIKAIYEELPMPRKK